MAIANSAFQTELAISTHLIVSDTSAAVSGTHVVVSDTHAIVSDTRDIVSGLGHNTTSTHTMVSEIHHTMVKGQEGSDGKNLPVSGTHPLSIPE